MEGEEAAPAEAVVEEVEATPEVEEPPASADANLLGATEDQPEFIRAMEQQLQVAGKDSFSISQEEFDQLPLAAKQSIYNLRKMALSKTQAAANERRQVETARRELEKERLTMEQERTKVYSMFDHEKLKALLEPPEGEIPSPYTEEGIEYRARLAAGKMLQQFMSELSGISKEQQAAVEQAVRDNERAERKVVLQTWMDQTPDYVDHMDAMKPLIETGLSVEDAYLLAKAKAGGLTQPTSAVDVTAARRASQAMSGRSSNAQQQYKAPDMKRGAEIGRFYQENPDAMSQQLEVLKRRGVGY